MSDKGYRQLRVGEKFEPGDERADDFGFEPLPSHLIENEFCCLKDDIVRRKRKRMAKKGTPHNGLIL